MPCHMRCRILTQVHTKLVDHLFQGRVLLGTMQMVCLVHVEAGVHILQALYKVLDRPVTLHVK